MKALSKPDEIAALTVFPDLNSSRILSKIMIFASTAIPTERTKPAIPGRVMVPPKMTNEANTIKELKITATSAIIPQVL